MNVAQATALIKKRALELGFSACGIARAQELETERKMLTQWLEAGCHGEMDYMANHFEKRLNPCLLVEEARSVIVVLMNYYPAQPPPGPPYIARYAWGTDYHTLVKIGLKRLLEIIHTEIGPTNGRAFCDSAPVLEKAWAARAGLGWIGKNTCMITRKGSWFFIGELIIDRELCYDQPAANRCGTCTRCLEACPTGALESPYRLNAQKCISYVNIEKKSKIATLPEKYDKTRLFGCDICQEVCPWNKKAEPHENPGFMPASDFFSLTAREWKAMNEKRFAELFQHTPVQRRKFENLKDMLKLLEV